MVILLGTKKEHEEAKEQGNPGGGRMQNSMANTGGNTMSGETVKYVNEGVRDGE